MKNLRARALVFLLFPAVVFGGERPTVDFLRGGAGARSVALGQAQVAMATDATSVYWNPAALTRLPGSHVILTNGGLVGGAADTHQLAWAQRRGAWGTGVALHYDAVDPLTRFDSSAVPIGTFRPADTAVTAALARSQDGHAWGINVKYIQTKIVDSANAGAVGFGYLSPLVWEGTFRWGLSIDNAGSKLKLGGQSESLPLLGRLGMTYVLAPGWEAVADVEKVDGLDPDYGGGVEYSQSIKSGRVFLRGGYTSRVRTGGDLAGLSAGLGLQIKNLGVDYAFLPDGDLGATHRVSLGLAWGAPSPWAVPSSRRASGQRSLRSPRKLEPSHRRRIGG